MRAGYRGRATRCGRSLAIWAIRAKYSNRGVGVIDVGTDVGKVFSRCTVDQLSDFVRAVHEGERDLALTVAAAGRPPVLVTERSRVSTLSLSMSHTPEALRASSAPFL